MRADKNAVIPCLATILNKRLGKLDLTRSDFVRTFRKEHPDSCSRSYLFKILNGQTIAGERGLLPLIAESLGLEIDDLMRSVRVDKMRTNKVVSPRVAATLKKRLRQLDMSRSDFIRKFQKEHPDGGETKYLFKILNGQAIAGERGLLPLIVESLGLKLDGVIKDVRADKIQAKDWLRSMPKANKIQQEVLTIMETMSRQDQEKVLRYAKMRAGQ